MKSKTTTCPRRALQILGGIFLIGIFFTHLKYLQVSTNAILLLPAANTLFLEDVPYLSEFKKPTKDYGTGENMKNILTSSSSLSGYNETKQKQQDSYNGRQTVSAKPNNEEEEDSIGSKPITDAATNDSGGGGGEGIDSNNNQQLKEEAAVTTEEEEPQSQSQPPFFQDTICGGCRHIIYAKARGLTCGSEIKTVMETKTTNNTINITQAVQMVVTEKSDLCKRCLPQACSIEEKRYWRYDSAFPKILKAKTHIMPSVSNRIPTNLLSLLEEGDYSVVDNNNNNNNNKRDDTTTTAQSFYDKLERYFSQPDNSYPKRQYLFDYNPSIVQLPKASHGHLLDKYPDAAYIASFRLSNLQSCFPTNVSKAMIGGNWDKRPEPINLLGLALLDKDLNLIQDVVVYVPFMIVAWMDYRMFVIDGTIYITSNCQMVPLWLDPKPTALSLRNVVVIKNMFPSPLKVAISTLPSLCSGVVAEIAGAKNLNYFVDANEKVMVEFLPWGPRVIRPVYPNLYDIRNGPDPKNDVRDESKALPPPSFYTREEIDLAERKNFFYNTSLTGYRGSACCVTIPVPESQKHRTNSTTLLLGITHVKTPHGRKKLQGVVKPNHYLSRFYAFEPTPPYRIVANSGYWCLPAVPQTSSTTTTAAAAAAAASGGDQEESNNNNNPLTNLPTFQSLDIGDTIYNCPVIHFVTGLVEKVTDPDILIIGYGVQDCTSWFIEVDKNEVIDLLFGPPKHKG